MSVALAESQHHSAQRPKMARAWGEVRVELHGHDQEHPSWSSSSFSRKSPAVPGHPVWVSRVATGGVAEALHGAHGGHLPFVQMLDASVSQMVDQLVAMIMHVDSVVPEQVIAVRKLSWPSRFPRAVLREPPTVVSLSLQQHLAEQNVVGAGGGSGHGLPGFLPAQSSSPSAADIPVPSRGFSGCLFGLHPGPSSTAPVTEQNVDIPVLRGGLQGFSSDQGPAAFSTIPPGDAFQFFSFPTEKSAEVTR